MKPWVQLWTLTLRLTRGSLLLKVHYWVKILVRLLPWSGVCKNRLTWQPCIQLVVRHHAYAPTPTHCCTALLNSDGACCSDIKALLLCCVTVSLQSNTSTRHKAAKELWKENAGATEAAGFLPFQKIKRVSALAKEWATVRHSVIYTHTQPPPPSPLTSINNMPTLLCPCRDGKKLNTKTAANRRRWREAERWSNRH